jgi:mono/diheme cytochrome c family protein
MLVPNLEGISMRTMWICASIAALAAIGSGDVSYSEEINLGKNEYLNSCASCHGATGKGDGPVSAELRTKPSDLTLIAKRNGGVFPADVLYRIIDGRRTFRAHGNYEMPVWGFVFRRSDPEDVARNRILALIAYLKSIQLK